MAKEPYPSETADRFIVRFPDGMRDRLKQAAADNNRSMNAEIIARLESSFKEGMFKDEIENNPVIRELADEIIRRIEATQEKRLEDRIKDTPGTFDKVPDDK